MDRKYYDAIERVRSYAGDAVQGLPEEVFELVTTLTPMVNVDLLFRNAQGEILLVWREDEICGCGWHIPGGIVRYKERMGERVQRTAIRELGTQIAFDTEPIAVNEIFVPQEIRGHFISFLYNCYLPGDYGPVSVYESGKTYVPGDMCWHKICPDQWVKGQKEIYAGLFEHPEVADDWPKTPTLPEETCDFSVLCKEIRAGNATFVFDIDGVIAHVDPSLQYEREKPFEEVIRIVNRLYDYGNEVILFTARGYKTGIDWKEVTQGQLEAWKVKYHELKFGKPAATFYIDDKNMDLNVLLELGKRL